MDARIARVAEPLFVSQARLEHWIETGEITFVDNIVTLVAQKKSYDMQPAAKVIGLLDGDDVLEIVGKVVTVAELQEKGAEHFADSIIYGDTAYQCQAGFVGLQRVAATEAQASAGDANTEAEAEAEAEDDMSLLTDFVLKNM